MTHILRKVLTYYDLEPHEFFDEKSIPEDYKVFENIEFDWSYSFDQEEIDDEE